MAQELIELDEAIPAGRPDTDPRWDLRRGHEIDKTLVVIGFLGMGSRYEVYRAWDRLLFCEVAVKVIRPHRVDDERAVAGFEREVTIGSRLAHPNLVRLVRWTASPPRPYLVMEYVSAPTVGHHLRETGAISVPEICLLGIRVACALHHMHANHLLHLDVKPDNVTMGDPPKLLDLSLARTFAGPMKLRHTMGTASYMAPEQCEHGFATPQTDLFGLAATLYEGISTMQPFPQGNDESKIREERFPQLTHEAPPLEEIENVPHALSVILMACLHKSPARRPRSAIEVALALHGVLEGFGLTELFAWPPDLRVRP